MDFENKRLLHTHGIGASLYINNALMGLVPPSSLEEMNILARLHQSSPQSYAIQVNKLEKTLKRNLAQLINAGTADDIALAQNTSSAISIVAHGLLAELENRPAQANIVLFADEYPSNREVWIALAHRYDLQARVIEPDKHPGLSREEMLQSHCDSSTLLLAVSAVQYSTGYVHDLFRLGEFCHSRGIFLMVDAIQACGVVPIDVASCRIDALACGSHKWLMSPEGAGFVYVNPLRAQEIKPTLYGWRTLAHATTGLAPDDTVHSSARRFESGTQPSYLLAALSRSVEIIVDLEVVNIQRYLAELKLRFISKIADIKTVRPAWPQKCSPENGCLSPILPLAVDNLAIESVVDKIAQEFHVYVMARNNCLRISPHIYNDDHSMSRLAEALRSVCHSD